MQDIESFLPGIGNNQGGNGQFFDTLSGFRRAESGILVQVPTEDNEIRDLLKGKTATQKRTLLKEIEKAKQARIHQAYLMEQYKNQKDEKWAVRNVEERQAILKLYDSQKAPEQESLTGQNNDISSRRDDTTIPQIRDPQNFAPTSGRDFDDEDPIVHNKAKVDEEEDKQTICNDVLSPVPSFAPAQQE